MEMATLVQYKLAAYRANVTYSTIKTGHIILTTT